MLNESREIFSTRQIADMFAVSTQTVDRWRKSGAIKAIIVGLGHPRFTRSAINEFITANESKGNRQ